MGAAAEQIAPAEAPEVTEAPAETAEAPAEGGDPPQPAEAGEVAEGEEAAAPTEPAPPEAPAEPAPPKETALFRRALRMREEGVAAKQEAMQIREEVKRERQELAARLAKVEEFEKRMARIEADPYAYFEEFNINPNDHARRLMNLNDPARIEIEKERAKDRETIRRLEERINREQNQRQEMELHGKVGQAKANFVRFVADNATEFPDLADEDEGEVSEVMWELASEHHRNTGRVPTFEMIAQHMQQQAEARRASRERRRQQRTGAARPTNPGGGQAAAPQRTAPTGQPTKGPGARAPMTLTNADTSTRTSLPRDATEEEVNEWAAQELRRAFRRDADS